MPLPSSGTITAAMINVELGRSSTAPFNLNDPAVRTLAGKPSGAISFYDFYGKSSGSEVYSPLSPVPYLYSYEPQDGFNQVYIVVNPDGSWYLDSSSGNVTGTGNNTSGRWLKSGDGKDVEFRITATSGSLTSNSASNWIAPKTGLAASINAYGPGEASVVFKIEFRNKNSGSIIGTTTGCFMRAGAAAPR